MQFRYEVLINVSRGVFGMKTVIRKLCRRFNIYRDVSQILVWRKITVEGEKERGG